MSVSAHGAPRPAPGERTGALLCPALTWAWGLGISELAGGGSWRSGGLHVVIRVPVLTSGPTCPLHYMGSVPAVPSAATAARQEQQVERVWAPGASCSPSAPAKPPPASKRKVPALGRPRGRWALWQLAGPSSMWVAGALAPALQSLSLLHPWIGLQPGSHQLGAASIGGWARSWPELFPEHHLLPLVHAHDMLA